MIRLRRSILSHADPVRADTTHVPQLLRDTEAREWGVAGYQKAAPAPEASGPADRLAGDAAVGGVAPFWLRLRRCPVGAAQWTYPSESQESVSVSEAPLRLHAVSESRLAMNRVRPCLLLVFCQSAAGGVLRASESGRSEPDMRRNVTPRAVTLEPHERLGAQMP